MKRLVYILLILFFGIADIISQDPQFSQYYSVPTYLGPSFAGATEGARVIANYRNQWPGVPETYQLYSLSYDKNVLHLKSGVGGHIIRDQLSPSLAKTIIGAQYSYQFFFKKPRIYIRPGLTFYYFNISYDMSEMVLGHQIEDRDITLSPSNIPPLKNVNKFDFNTSCLAYTEYIWLGVAIDHLTRTNESLTNTKSISPIKYTLFSGYKFDFNRYLVGHRDEKSISGTFLYKRQGSYDQLDIGAYFTNYPYTIGIWYRGIPVEKNEAAKADHDALVFLAGIRYDQLKLSYSFDVSISSMFLKSKGAHEITLTWEIPYKDPRKKIVPLPCAQF